MLQQPHSQPLPESSWIMSQIAGARCQSMDSGEDENSIKSFTLFDNDCSLAIQGTSHLRLWDFNKRTHSLLQNILIMNADQLFAIIGTGKAKADLLDLQTLRRVSLKQFPTNCTGVALSADRSMLSACTGRYIEPALGDGLVRSWRLSDGRSLGLRRVSQEPVDHVRFSHSGKLLAAGSQDGVVRILDAGTRSILATLRPDNKVQILDIAFSGDDRLLLVNHSTCCGCFPRLWDLSSHKEIEFPPSKYAWKLESGLFGPDGSLAFICQWPHQCTWNITIPEAEIFQICGSHRIKLVSKAKLGSRGAAESRMLNAAFRPNRKELATLDDDGRIRLWSLEARPKSPPPREAGQAKKEIDIFPSLNDSRMCVSNDILTLS